VPRYHRGYIQGESNVGSAQGRRAEQDAADTSRGSATGKPAQPFRWLIMRAENRNSAFYARSSKLLFGVRIVADTRLTRIDPLRALKLCVVGAFLPQKLVEAQRADDEVRKKLPQPPPPPEHSAFRVRRALWESLLWVLCSLAVGYLGGRLLNVVVGQATEMLVRTLQVVGATLLLWGTLFVRGWDIQTKGGISLTQVSTISCGERFCALGHASPLRCKARGPLERPSVENRASNSASIRG